MAVHCCKKNFILYCFIKSTPSLPQLFIKKHMRQQGDSTFKACAWRFQVIKFTADMFLSILHIKTQERARQQQWTGRICVVNAHCRVEYSSYVCAAVLMIFFFFCVIQKKNLQQADWNNVNNTIYFFSAYIPSHSSA